MAENIEVIATSKVDDVLRDFQKIAKEQQKVNKNFQKMAKGSRKAGKEAKSGFGSNMATMVMGFGASVLSVSTAFKAVADAIALTNKVAAESLDKYLGIENARKQLKQLGGGEVFRQNERETREFSTKYGIAPIDAYKLQFDTESLGATSQRDRELIGMSYGAVQASPIMKTAKMIETAKGSVNYEKVANVLLASARTSGENATDIATSAPKAYATFQDYMPFQRFGPLLAQSTDVFGNSKEASTRMNAFLGVAERKAGELGIKEGDTFDQIMASVNKKIGNMSIGDKATWLANKEAAQFYKQYNRPAFQAGLKSRQREVDLASANTGTSKSLIKVLGQETMQDDNAFIQMRNEQNKTMFDSFDIGLPKRAAEIKTVEAKIRGDVQRKTIGDIGDKKEAWFQDMYSWFGSKYLNPDEFEFGRGALFEEDQGIEGRSAFDIGMNFGNPRLRRTRKKQSLINSNNNSVQVDTTPEKNQQRTE